MVNDDKKKVQTVLDRVHRAQKKRKEQEDDWKTNFKAVFGNDWMEKGTRADAGTSSPTSKKKYDFDLCLAFLKNELPSLVLDRPEVFLNATEAARRANPDAQAQVKLLEARINEILGDMDDFATEIRISLTDAFCAYGIVKVLPKTAIEPHPQAGQPVTDNDGTELLDPVTQQPLVYPAEQVASSPNYEVCRVDPFKFLIDERAKNSLVKATWPGDEIDRTLEEIKYSGLYPADVVERLETKIREKEQGKPKEDWEIELKLYEIYHHVEKKLMTICEQYQDEFMRYEDIPEGIERDPYVTLKLTEIPGQWFPKPEISSGRTQQDDYRQGREWQRSRAKKLIPQVGVKPAVKDDQRKKLGDGISDWVELTNQGDVFPIEKSSQNQTDDLEKHMAVCIRDFDQIMGQTQQSRGLVGDAKFATEVEIAEAQGNMREKDKIQLVKTFFSRIVEKLLMLVKVNPAEADEIRNIAINVDLNVEIDIESKTAKNKAIDRKQLTEVLTIIAQNPMFAQSPTLMDQILRDYDIRERDKIIQEIQAATTPKETGPQPPSLSVSLPIKWELLGPQTQNQIIDWVTQQDIKMPVDLAKAGQGQWPTQTESVGAGLEGMEPGAGMAMEGAA